jgi:hypothetical protein
MAKINILSFALMAEKWPSPILARNEIERLKGGVVTRKYLSNLDCLGRGPKGRFLIGRRIVYPLGALVDWLQQRSQIVE